MLNSRLWRLLASHKVALLLIGLLAMAAVVGGTLPQTGRLSPEQRQGFQTEWGGISSWLEMLQFSHVFGSWWFTLLYAALIINVAAGTIQSTTWRYRWYQGRLAPSFRIEGVGQLSTAHLRPLRSAFGFSPSQGGQLRGVAGLWGAPILHLGIMVIVLGGIWSAIQGFGAHLELSEGEPYIGQREKLAMDRGLEMPTKLDVSLRLEQVRVELSRYGHLRELQAHFLVREREGTARRLLAEINRPLKLGIYELSPNKTGGYSAVFERIRKDGSRREMFIHFNVPLHEWNWEGEWMVQRDVLVELDDTPLYYKMKLKGKGNPSLSLVVKHGVDTLFDGELKPGSVADLGEYQLIFKGVVPWLGFYLTTDYPKYVVFAGFIVMLGGFLLHLLHYPRRIEVTQGDSKWVVRIWVMPSDWRFKEFWQQNFARESGERWE